MRFNFLAVLLLLLLTIETSHAQHPATLNSPQPVLTYLDLAVGSTGSEAGLAARVRPRLATGLFAKIFWQAPGTFNNFDNNFVAGFKAKFYRSALPNSLFVGPLIGGHTFGPGFRPLVGLTAGFDHYNSFIIIRENREFRVGIELQAGLDTEGEGYVGAGVSIGLGFLNAGLEEESGY